MPIEMSPARRVLVIDDCLTIHTDHVTPVRKGAPIRLATDGIMPLMDGKVMAEWMKTVYPDLKILTSGHADDAIRHHGVSASGFAFLPKPYIPVIFAGKVYAMLDNETGTAFL